MTDQKLGQQWSRWWLIAVPLLVLSLLFAFGLLAQTARATANGAVISSGAISKLVPNDTPTPTPTPTICGLAWRVVSSSSVGSDDNYFRGVAALSANDVWAVGYYYNESGYQQTLMEHWDGNQWSIVPSPNNGKYGNYIYGVAALSANDVWAVGSYLNSGKEQTLIEHWNGSQWRVMPSPNSSTSHNILIKVEAVSTNDVWAVGFYNPTIDSGSWTLIEHWDGQQWTIVPGPNVDLSNNLYSIAALSANDIWAAGNQWNGSTVQTLIEHWNGNQWSIVSSPNLGSDDNYFYGVAAVSANDVWAVGKYGVYPNQQTLVEHWNGTTWSIVYSPNLSSQNNYLYGVAAVSANDVWAVGEYWNGPVTQTLIEHWGGSLWSVVSGPNVGSNSNILRGVAVVSANDVWAVGYYNNGGIWQTLTERYSDLCGTPTSTNTATRIPTMPPATNTPTRINTPLPTVTPGGPTVTPKPPTATRTNMVVAATNTPIPPNATPTLCPINFTDVHQSDYFYTPVRYLYCHNVLSGYGTEFRPYNNTSRGQLCKIVVLGANLPIDTSGGPHFTDMPADNVFYPYVETAFNRGIVNGYGTEFRPNDNVTRGQLCKIIVLAKGWDSNVTGGPHFTDVLPGSTFYSYVETAFNKGIISGYGSLFKPNDPATRGQISKIVYLAVSQGSGVRDRGSGFPNY